MGEFTRGMAVIFVLWCVVVLLGYDKDGGKQSQNPRASSSPLLSSN